MINESSITGPSNNGRGMDATRSPLRAAEAIPSQVSRELHNLIADVEELIGETSLLNGEDLARVRAKVSAGVSAAKESLEAMGHAIDGQARKTASLTNGYVHEQPWNAIGLGVSVGVLLGFLLAKRA